MYKSKLNSDDFFISHNHARAVVYVSNRCCNLWLFFMDLMRLEASLTKPHKHCVFIDTYSLCQQGLIEEWIRKEGESLGSNRGPAM